MVALEVEAASALAAAARALLSAVGAGGDGAAASPGADSKGGEAKEAIIRCVRAGIRIRTRDIISF